MTYDDRYRLETPENIEVDFPIAGLGSRFCALAIDGCLQTLAVIVLLIILTALDISIFKVAGQLIDGDRQAIRDMAAWATAFVLIFVLLIWFGAYHLLFELLMRGQTPGKRAMRIRTIAEDGTPMTAGQALTRNLIRLFDALPGCYVVGGLVMFFHPMSKRLGDLAAGTLVVKEGEADYRSQTDRRKSAVAKEQKASNIELSPEERRVLTGFLNRKHELLPEARRKLGRQLAEQAFEKHGGIFDTPEKYIARLVEGRHYEP